MIRNTVLGALFSLLAAFPGQDKKTGAEVLFAPTGDRRLLEDRISQELASAKREIVVAMYQFTSSQLSEGLLRAKRKGIAVRVLLDGLQAAESGKFASAIRALDDGGIDLRYVYADGQKRKGGGAFRPRFHHKFCVIDGERVLTGSYNWTVQGDTDNHENLLILLQRDVARKYLDRFEEIWKNDGLVQKELP